MKFVIALIQIFDSGVHLVTGQIEPLRLSASLLVLIWLFAIKSQRFDWGVVGLYIFANSLFLFREGFLNAGSPRIFFLAAVISTVLLSWRFISKKE